MKPIRKGLSTYGALMLFAWVAATPVQAYHQDTHYHLRFALALASCFEWQEAHLIASGDWMLDENASTVAEMNPLQKANKVRWHAFGHDEQRLNELWLRALDAAEPQLQMVKLGQLMHFLEDWEAHAGFGVRMGHARATVAGKDPDSLGRSLSRNQAMVQTGLAHMLKVCSALGRPAAATSDTDLALARLLRIVQQDGLLGDLHRSSDPKWKKGNATLGKRGREILSSNQRRAEQFIELLLKSEAAKGVPAGFVAGDRDHGIPPPLRMRYDRDGELLLPASAEATRGAAPALSMAAANLAQILPVQALFDLELVVTDAMVEEAGWRVAFELRNHGPETSQAGEVQLIVVDSMREEVLGQASTVVGSLPAGHILSAKLLVPGNAEATKVVAGGYVAIDDGSAENNQSWYSTWNDPGPEEVEEQLRGPGSETILLAGEPRVLLLGENSFCALIRAYTSDGDSSEKLGPVEFQLADEAGVNLAGARVEEPVWCAVEAAGDGRVVAQTVLCVTLESDPCTTFESARPASLRIGVDSAWASTALEAELPAGSVGAELLAACGSR